MIQFAYEYTDDAQYKNCKELIIENPDRPLEFADYETAEEIYDRVMKDPDFNHANPKPQFLHFGELQWICTGKSAYKHAQEDLKNCLDHLRQQTVKLQAYLDTMPSWEQIEKTEK